MTLVVQQSGLFGWRLQSQEWRLPLSGCLCKTTQTIANLDVGQLFDNGSQFWIIVMFVFFISALCSLVVNFVFTLIPSDKEMNKYGPPPPPAF
jgi:hypothetical protein